MSRSSDVKVSTLTSETMVPLPGVAGAKPPTKKQNQKKESASATSERQKSEQKKSRPHYIYYQIKRTSLSVILSLLYAKIVITACVAIVASQEITHQLPNMYYEGFFIYLFSVSIFFNFIMFCFFLRNWMCCANEERKSSGDKKKTVSTTSARKRSTNASTREVYPRKIKDIVKSMERKDVHDDYSEEDVMKEGCFEHTGSATLVMGSTNERLIEPSPNSDEVEIGTYGKDIIPNKKTTQNMHHYGSFYMRLGTIGLGLGAMIYCGLQFRLVADTQYMFLCYHNLQTVNTILYMTFIFLQMYFIFLHARVNIHCYKMLARFGLMHMLATNVCVWIRSGVFECMKKLKRPIVVTNSTTKAPYSIMKDLVNEYKEFSSDDQLRKMRESVLLPTDMLQFNKTEIDEPYTVPFSAIFVRTVQQITDNVTTAYQRIVTSTIAAPTIASTVLPTSEFTRPTAPAVTSTLSSSIQTSTSMQEPTSTASFFRFLLNRTTVDTLTTPATTVITDGDTLKAKLFAENVTTDYVSNMAANNKLFVDGFNSLLVSNNNSNLTCNQLNIMKGIMEESAPYLYPFAIEYSLIGAAVIFIIWRHIGRYPRYVSEENIERKLEQMLSQKAVALAHAQSGTKMDCVGASKGLFFGLLIFVGSVISLILYFVLVLQTQLKSMAMAIYLVDLSHTTIMALSILAILIGFIRAKKLKFYPTDSSELNDLLLAFTAVGMFVYSLFGIIAGARYAVNSEKHLFVMITGIVTIVQVVLQFLFINDMSKRHVYLPEHDRNKPGRQIVTFLIICNITMWMLFVFESRKVSVNPIQLEYYGFAAWTVVEHVTLPLCMFHRFYSSITLAEIWKNSYKQCIE